CCSPAQVEIVAEVSTDGENWTSWDVRNGLAPNNTSANPVNQVINISSVAAGHDQVWIRFRKTGATHYWWMIDDVTLVSYVDNDMEITSITYNNGYTKIPAGQQQPFQFSAEIRNSGGFVQNDIVLETAVNNLLFNATNDTIDAMDSGEQLNLMLPGEFMPPGRGEYTAEFALSQMQIDEVPANNLATAEFYITDTVYSRSPDVYNTELFYSREAGDLTAGNRFTLLSEMEATSVGFVLHENSEPGARLKIKLYSYNDGIFTEIYESNDFYLLSSDDITPPDSEEPVFLVLPLDETLIMPAGDYIVAAYAPAGDQVALATQNLVKQPASAAFEFTDNSWNELAAVPMINLHFGNHEVACDPLYDFIVQDAVCGTESGSIEVVPLTGTGPWNYLWTDDPLLNSPIRENLPAGEYELTVTDGYGCVADLSVAVEDVDISMDFEVTDAMCATGGVITMIPLNGQEPFVYDWSHDETLDGPVAEDLSPGSYNVIIADANGCETNITVEVGNIDEMPVDVFVQPAYCGNANGSIELVPQAGVAPFTFNWDGIDTTAEGLLDTLTAGNYTFSVADVNGCTYEGDVTISEEIYDLELDYTVFDATCGFNNGEIMVEITNGSEPYHFQWSNSLDQPAIGNLAPGTYVLQVADKFGCDIEQSFIVNSIGEMPQVNWGVTDSEDCSGSSGIIAIFSEDPEASYVYTLINDENGVIVEDPDGGDDSPDFLVEGLPAGQYYISVLSEDECERILTLEVSDAGAPEITANITTISCHGEDDGAIDVTVNGGTNPQFLWNDEDESTTPGITNLSAGLYTLQVTDDGCFGMESFEIIEPDPLLANATIEHIVCANEEQGSIYLQTLGGTAPYTYIWSNGVSNLNLLDVQGGDYTITITDFHNCVFNNAYTIQANDSLLLSADVVHSNDSAENGSIVVSVSGGEGEYIYSWDTGQQTPVLTGLAPGSYTITVTDEAGCFITETFMIGTVSVEDHFSDQELVKVYPNPASQILNVETNAAFCSEAVISVDLTNIVGKNVKSISFDNAGGAERLSIDVGDMYPGIYIITVKCGNKVKQTKFVKR
ncbi:MAG: T9SS type A sorting domain-containing protein, partial [Bacteroidales bacterium]